MHLIVDGLERGCAKMRTQWFRLSLNDGRFEAAKPPSESRPSHWVERDLEHLLALNPAFLDVADYLPPRLAGAQQIAEKFGRSLGHLRAWSEGTTKDELDPKSLRRLGDRVV